LVQLFGEIYQHPIATLACLFQLAGLKLESQKLNQICSEKLAFEESEKNSLQ
jgi:hypothetical protein